MGADQHLGRMGHQLEVRAEATQMQWEEWHFLRAKLVARRQDVIATCGASTENDDAFRLLRRELGAEAASAGIAAMETMLETQKMSGTYKQIPEHFL